ncbi:MAG TPA: UPF0175 family protein [Candidatus Thermoplasmatota archaeon]|nr:UPF0175 family protein [Candidatus Thermoplasmatota archaeon]
MSTRVETPQTFITNHDNACVMENLQVRLPDEDVAALDALAVLLHSSRSEAARRALDEGLRSLRASFALERFASGEFSLARAAEFAGVSLDQMARRARDQGLAYIRYEPAEAADDARTAAKALRGRRDR